MIISFMLYNDDNDNLFLSEGGHLFLLLRFLYYTTMYMQITQPCKFHADDTTGQLVHICDLSTHLF